MYLQIELFSLGVLNYVFALLSFLLSQVGDYRTTSHDIVASSLLWRANLTTAVERSNCDDEVARLSLGLISSFLVFRKLWVVIPCA